MAVEIDAERCATEYAATRARVREVLSDLSPGQEETVVPACPDWTVRNLAAHLAGVAADLVARRNPTGDTQAWVDAQVAERAAVPVAELLDEFDAAGPGFEGLIRNRPRSFAGLLYDVVSHEHDAANALGRPADRSSGGVVLSLDIMFDMVERDLAANGLGAVRCSDGVRSWEVGEGEVGLTIETDTYELFRLVGSRRSLHQMRDAGFVGDLDAHLPGLCHLPLPTTDLVE
ncbi:MAG: maleylpyruvate isomerase family mycothiol-dependent enzyme [Actinomycetota bacterium]